MSRQPRRSSRRRLRGVFGLALSMVLAVTLAGSAAARPLALTPTPLAAPATWNPAAIKLALRLEVGGLTRPIYFTSARDDSGRMFVVEQGGRIEVFRNGRLNATPFLDLSTKVSTGEEQGLLGLAFHPQFRTNGKLYVDFTMLNGDTAINEYRVGTNPDQVDMTTGRRILTIPQPYANHNGGHMAFGPDGYLYIATGDGGNEGDPGNRAQSLTTLLGKILRIDVNGTTPSNGAQYRIPASNPLVGKPGWDEIWSWGLRNPWRFSFDRANGNLWIGDVGQDRYEEIDRATSASGAGRGANFGWRVMEGRHCYDPGTGCSPTAKVLPVVEYPHVVAGQANCSVTGGYVYRATAFPDLVGGYLFGDFCSGRIWGISATATSPATPTLLLDSTLSISSFGENQAGDLFVTDLRGAVYRVVDAG